MKRIVLLFACSPLLQASIAFAQETADEGGAITGRTVLDMFQRGGALMWPILLCSVVGFAFVLERIVSLRASVIFPRKLLAEVRSLVGQGKIGEAVRLCADSKSEFGKLLHACLGRADASGFEMEAAIEETGARILNDLRKNARPLSIIADVSPLLGLMGTVTGMIRAFEAVARAGALGRTQLLAEGIAEALLTTAFGLSVAIPAIIFYHFFRTKADGIVRAMEDASLEILGQVRENRKNSESDPSGRRAQP